VSGSATPGVRLERLEDGQVLHLTLDLGKGNIIDLEAIGELRTFVRAVAGTSALKALILDHAGDHFSFGASVEDHLPGRVEEMLPAFHALAKEILDLDLPTLAVVRGQCLGGGLEVALLADRICASPTAFFGQPEIRLAVFAPLASLLLPTRIGKSDAFDLLLSGRSIDATAARDLGLIDEIAADPLAAALHWVRERLLSQSGAAIRLATRAARLPWRSTFEDQLDNVERLYLDELMETSDALEGIQAFLSRRDPAWRDR
jgi:cyclohexa-1,5-dienecarbonyl-CoA hydratase